MNSPKQQVSITQAVFLILSTVLITFVVLDLWNFSPHRYQLIGSSPATAFRLNKETGEVSFIRYSGERLSIISTK